MWMNSSSPSRYGRAGVGDHRDPRALRRGGYRRGRLRRRTRSPLRDRRRQGRPHHGHPGRLMSQAMRKLSGAINRPVRRSSSPTSSAKRLGHVWQSRNDHRRQRPQVLRLCPPGRPANPIHQGRRRDHRQRTRVRVVKNKSQPLPDGGI